MQWSSLILGLLSLVSPPTTPFLHSVSISPWEPIQPKELRFSSVEEAVPGGGSERASELNARIRSALICMVGGSDRSRMES